MSVNFSGSDNRPAGGTPDGRRMRLAAVLVSAILGGVFVVWAAMQYFEKRGGSDRVPDSAPRADSRPSQPMIRDAKAAPGKVGVHVVVSMRKEDGSEAEIGTSLPRTVALKIMGGDGRAYEARFDRVGVWLMEVPPGEYTAPLAQDTLGDWRWTLKGEGVVKGESGYTMKFSEGTSSPRVELALH